MFVSNLSLKYKIALPVALIISLFAVTFTAAIIAFNKQANYNLDYSEHIKPVQLALDDAYRDLYQAEVAVLGLANTTSEDKVANYIALYRDETKKTYKRIATAQMAIDRGFLEASHQTNLDTALTLFNQWTALNEKIVTNPAQANNTHQKMSDDLHRTFTPLVKNLKTIKDQMDENAKALEVLKINAIDDAKTTMEVGGTLALVIAAALTMLLTKSIMTPIRRINAVMEDIANGDGDLTARLPIESKDELGQLASTFNLFTQKIQHTISDVISASTTVRLEMDKFNQITHQVMVKAQSQQHESDAVATAVNELSATSALVSDNANSASESSQQASGEAGTTDTLIQHTIESISEQANELQQASNVVNSLENDVTNIASILDVIRGVAEQTNLLALNAAIEAARAGEQGRGFAVVADEVRALASKTQHSAGEIQSMIEKLQVGSQQAVKVMAISQTNSAEMETQAQEVGLSLQTIMGSITTMNELNMHIASAADEQRSVSEDVNSNIQSIAESSHQMVGLVANAETAYHSLSEQCERLDQLVGQFKV
ncbi:methyl-accepting chemotaxis protein [Vibrio tapetis]|uniref:Methyl-accepting chemotaxis protein I (Serine chemoreceptor protein) n=1 Tax=Vibrio tapetis subsp. tapetis TaxID=1671868 RepID=A0A2N8ZFZ3_9VIBR|nr:methyl-accepting chemotaxis protein [Vibrio tapetis]SON50839.1 Methyl-accepting chemotaxis protein I (Serine chemoreceptor protein) [Vibrio tapetis subsp. tapetis]